MGVSRRQCESQGDQINPAKALDSKSTKHCPYSDSCSVQESQQLCWPPAPHTPLATTHATQDLRTARPGPSAWSRTRPPPCGQKAPPQPGWEPSPGAHSGGICGQESPKAPTCPAAARTPPLPQTPSGVEEGTGRKHSSRLS